MGAIPSTGLLLVLLICGVLVPNLERRGGDGYGEAASVNLRHLEPRMEVLKSDVFRKMGREGGREVYLLGRSPNRDRPRSPMANTSPRGPTPPAY